MIYLFNRLQRTIPHVRTVEEELLILCLQRALASVDLERVSSLLREPLNWEYFLSLATRHGVSGLVHQMLLAELNEDVPPDIMRFLETDTRTSGNHSLYLLGELLKVSTLFHDHGIEFLPLKGPVLALTLYGSTYLRPYIDIDLLVKKEDFALAQQILIGTGYIISEEGHTLPQFINNLNNDYHVVLIHQGKNTCIELHWGLVTSLDLYRVDVENLWSRLVLVRLNNIEVLNLPPHDQLLMLSVHGAKHRWGRLKWLYDIAAFIYKYPELDWWTVIQEAQELHLERILLLNLWLVHSLLNVDIPKEIIDYIQKNSLLKILSVFAQGWIFTRSRSNIDKAKYVFFYFDVRETWNDKINYLTQYLIKKARATPSFPLRNLLYAILFFFWILHKVSTRNKSW